VLFSVYCSHKTAESLSMARLQGSYGASYIPRGYVEDSPCAVLSNALLLEGVPTGVTRESNRRDHLLYFLRACLPKSADLCAQRQIPWFKDVGTRLEPKKNLLLNGDPTGPGKCSDTTCYALNLQMIPKYRICEEKIPRTQNMRRKDTQNTE
jgi:hypothetical protein